MTVIQLARARNIAASPTIRPWQHVGWYILIPWLLVALALAAMPSRVYAADRIFVPMVLMNRGPVEGSSDTPVPCTLSGAETAVLAKMASSLEQRRPSLTCDPILAAVARARAQDMAARDYFSHVTPEGKGPNTLVVEAGYVLPDWYSDARDANNLESIAGGFATPTEVWNAWMESRGHRTHLLALDSFYTDQVKVGIGYATAPGSRFEHYWVVITAPDPSAAPEVP